jgi:hypothetical protein
MELRLCGNSLAGHATFTDFFLQIPPITVFGNEMNGKK